MLAATAVGVATGRLELPVNALTRGGFELGVDGELDGGRLVRWSLSGDARLIAEGSLHPEARARLEPPDW